MDILDNPELQLLLNNKSDGYKYRERREDPWRENYELYRDHVTVNRLIQRQSVNLPLMKTVLRTLMKDIDDMPVIEFENLDNDKQAQVFQNEYWAYILDINNAEVQDIVDKKQDFFAGRTFTDWQIIDGKIRFDVDDYEDILVSRFMNPYDIDSSRFLIHTHIFKPLSSLKRNKDYDQKEVAKLEEFFKSQQGIVKAKDNENSLQKKNQKMSELGDTTVDDPVLGETYVELTLHHVFRAEKNDEEEQIYVYVEAEDQTILMKKAQEDIIDPSRKCPDHFWRDHYRYDTWGDDVDKQDFWTDGIADITRNPNKIMNAWFSQEVERRTLSNFGMTFYDATKKAEGFMPNTYEPRAFGFYGVPGKPSDFLQRVEIPMNDGNLEAISFVQQFTERATGATATKQGVQTPGQATKFEVNAVLTEATERTQGMSKFYTKAWERRGLLFLKLIEAGADRLDAVKIYKKGRNTDDIFAREIAPKDWMTPLGYRVKVWSQDEKKSKDTDALTKLNAVVLNMMGNPKLLDYYQRKLLEFAEVPPDDITAIMEFEHQKLTPVNPMVDNGQGGQGGQVAPPQLAGFPPVMK